MPADWPPRDETDRAVSEKRFSPTCRWKLSKASPSNRLFRRSRLPDPRTIYPNSCFFCRMSTDSTTPMARKRVMSELPP